MGLDTGWIRLLLELFPGVFRATLESRGFDLVAIDSTLDLHRAAELKPSVEKSTYNTTVKSAIEKAAVIATRFVNGGNPEYAGPSEQAYYWADKSLVVCADNPMYVPRAKNSTQAKRGDGTRASGIMDPAEFARLFAKEISGDKSLDAIYTRTLEMFAQPPKFATEVFWRTLGFRWMIHAEFSKCLEKANLGQQQTMVIDPYVHLRENTVEWLYRTSLIDTKISDPGNTVYAKLGAIGQQMLTRHARIRISSNAIAHVKVPSAMIGEGEQKVISYIDPADTAHMSYLIVCNDNDVLYSILAMMPSLINPQTGCIDKEIWVDMSKQNIASMTPLCPAPTRFVNVVELWRKIMTYMHRHSPRVVNPIETFSFLACCTGSDFNSSMESTVHGLKTSCKTYWNVFSAITATTNGGYIDCSGNLIKFDTASDSNSVISKLVTVARCCADLTQCTHRITIDPVAFDVFYAACCAASIEATQRIVQTMLRKFTKKRAARKAAKPSHEEKTPAFAFTIRDIRGLVDMVDQLKADVKFLEGLVRENQHNFPEKVLNPMVKKIKAVNAICISRDRCDVKRISLEWTLNYMRFASTGMNVKLDTPLDVSLGALRKSTNDRTSLPPPPHDYNMLQYKSRHWPWDVEPIKAPSSHDYNNAYHQIECIHDNSSVFSTQLSFSSITPNPVLQ